MRQSRALEQQVSAEMLGMIRAAVFLMWLVEVAPDPLSFWGELPRSMHQPIGAFKLIPETAWDRILEPDELDRLQTVLVALLALCALGVRPYRPTATATAAVLTGHQAVLRGFAFTNHEELALLVCAYVLALFPAADGFAWPGRRRPTAPPETYGVAVDAMSLLLLLPYCGIAARRLVRATPTIFTGDSLPHWLGALDALDRDAVGIGKWALRHRPLVVALKAGFVVTTAFELLAPLCLVVPRFRRAWIPVIGTMHLINRFTLKLFFWQNSLLILLLLTGIPRRLAGAHVRVSALRQRARRTRRGKGWSWTGDARW